MLMKEKNWPEPTALTSTFSVELPGIEPAPKSQLSCANADSDDAKQRETTCDYAKGVDGINTPSAAALESSTVSTRARAGNYGDPLVESILVHHIGQLSNRDGYRKATARGSGCGSVVEIASSMRVT
jgi:hypothetical protein